MSSSSCRLLLPIALFGLALARLAEASPLDPGSTLCLYPVGIPAAKEEGEARRAELERRLIQALQAVPYRVPEPAQVKAIDERVRREVGGFIDPANGRRIPSRYRAYRKTLATTLRNELGCDAGMGARVALVHANFQNGTVKWDGLVEQASSTGRVVLNIVGGVSESGWVAALSLHVGVFDWEENDLSFRTAGIESLVRFAVLRDRDIVPEDVWLTDTAKIDAAIALALGPAGKALRYHGTPQTSHENPDRLPGPSDEHPTPVNRTDSQYRR